MANEAKINSSNQGRKKGSSPAKKRSGSTASGSGSKRSQPTMREIF